MALKNVTVRIDESMLEKINYVSDYEGRSVNSHVLILIRDYIQEFEEKHGKITGPIDPSLSARPTNK